MYYLYRVGSFSFDTAMVGRGDTETDLATSPPPTCTVPEALVLKVRLADKAAPSVPSVLSVWAGADFQEREVYDMMGVRFTGHPELKRILMWDGYAYYPLRKDFLEPYLRGARPRFSRAGSRRVSASISGPRKSTTARIHGLKDPEDFTDWASLRRSIPRASRAGGAAPSSAPTHS